MNCMRLMPHLVGTPFCLSALQHVPSLELPTAYFDKVWCWMPETNSYIFQFNFGL